MRIERNTTQFSAFDLGIFGLGYESRSLDCFVGRGSGCSRSVAIGYSYFLEEFDYRSNKESFLDRGAEVRETDDKGLLQVLQNLIDPSQLGQEPTILLDISVFSRHRLCKILWFLFGSLPVGARVVVNYSVAEFVDPPVLGYPVRQFGPVIEELNTLPGRPSLPISVIVGLGYEPEKALGAVGVLDPGTVFFLVPLGVDSRYEESVRVSNQALLASYGSQAQLTYSIERPYSTYIDLKGLLSRLRLESRVMILPLGPKVLSAISIVLAWEYYPDISVWRVSSEEAETPVNKKSSGVIVEFLIQF